MAHLGLMAPRALITRCHGTLLLFHCALGCSLRRLGVGRCLRQSPTCLVVGRPVTCQSRRSLAREPTWGAVLRPCQSSVACLASAGAPTLAQ